MKQQDEPNITDDMLRSMIDAMKPDRIQGFLYGTNTPSPVYVIRDVWQPHDKQELWRKPESECDEAEWSERCEMERMRVGLAAALRAANKGA